MKSTRTILAVCMWVGLCASGQAWSQSTKATPSKHQSAHAEGASKYDGAKLYARYCALCHGDNREGYAADEAPSLRSPQLIASAPGSYLWTAISYGRPNTPMAAFADTQGGPLSHDAQHALVDWLIEESGLKREPSRTLPWWETLLRVKHCTRHTVPSVTEPEAREGRGLP